ncbi:MAG: hypothetical protein IJX06_02230 [Clostridia bacterium]|nr:hypothetical protein [Clostridia bacterium]
MEKYYQKSEDVNVLDPRAYYIPFTDQDKLRYTGIFRDVYILSRPEGHITDYRIDTTLDGTVGFTLENGSHYGTQYLNLTNGETTICVEGISHSPLFLTR